MEPWFEWSWLLGIRPVHPNGWVALGCYLLVSTLLAPGSLGMFGNYPLLRAICALGFLASSLAFFWTVFWNFSRSE